MSLEKKLIGCFVREHFMIVMLGVARGTMSAPAPPRRRKKI